MHAYIDESGHTGPNLLDPAQPDFLNVAMSSMVDFDEVFNKRVTDIASGLGVERLHASELRYEGVESAAAQLIELIEFSRANFYFAHVRKPDVAVLKFYDAVFDPGENPAAPHHTYLTRTLKFLLLLRFSTLLRFDDVDNFWSGMMTVRSSEAEGKVVSAIDAVLSRVHQLPDMRSQELIGDTLRWARDHVGEFSFWSAKKKERYGHLPNIFTFPILMQGIFENAKIWKSPIETIVHDQQSQFGPTLHHWHALFSGIEPERIFNFGDTPIEFPDLRESTFATRDSRDSGGLQVVDVVLWIFGRIVGDRPVGPNATRLFDAVFSYKDLFVLSLGWIELEVELTVRTLNERELSDEDLLRGQKIIQASDRLRRTRIADSASRSILSDRTE